MTTDDAFKDVPPPLRAAMEKRGFTSLTAVQSAVIGKASADLNLRISSQTGSGKTIAIGLVLANALSSQADPGASERRAKKTGKNRSRALIITPTRELAVQVQGELHWLFENLPGLDVTVVTGGSDMRRERLALQRSPAIVVGTPGRMLDHLRTGALGSNGIEHVALDEADRMLDMGFREELEAIVESLPKNRRSHLMSATFPPGVKRLADRFQDNHLHVQGTTLGKANENIEHSAHLIRASDRYGALVNSLLISPDSRCLVFVERRNEAADFAERLAKDGFAALPFSGELAQAQRTRTLAAFRNGSIRILVSTDVAARGIDVPDIGMVIQLTMPTDADTYTHRSGRTGRAGRTGRSILLVPKSSERRAHRILDGARVKVNWQPVPGPDQIKKMARKALRRELHGRLDAEEGPGERELEYATSLIQERDPAKVIAVLMKMAEPSSACAPVSISALLPGEKDQREGRPKDKNRDFTRFLINWGEKDGATTPRLLSHVCRRGDIKSKDVGAIRIGPQSSTFEISSSLSRGFERQVSRPDERDPELKIKRDASERRPSRKPAAETSRGSLARRTAPKPAWKKKAKSDKESGASKAREGSPSRPPRRKKRKPSPQSNQTRP
ncbi:MAG: helicase [Deltaproteobacteria bacterium]|nr:helicase [Deltaproteobacteria bacterium]